MNPKLWPHLIALGWALVVCTLDHYGVSVARAVEIVAR